MIVVLIFSTCVEISRCVSNVDNLMITPKADLYLEVTVNYLVIPEMGDATSST
jgi:hypothetical protein